MKGLNMTFLLAEQQELLGSVYFQIWDVPSLD
jgi:hypothetical protein